MKKLSHILIIDDDPMTSYLHKKLIEGFKVADRINIANDGEEALQLFNHYIQSDREDSEENIPQLVFVDLDMPMMDGFEFLDAYQGLEFRNKNSVVIAVLTSSFSRSDINRVKEFPEVKDYIVKPLTKEKMMELMDEHFDLHVEGGLSL